VKIFLAAQQSPHRYPIPAYHFWVHYLRAGLIEAGHTVVEATGADWARGLLALTHDERRAWHGETWGRVIDTLRTDSGRADLFLGYLYPQQVDRGALGELRSLGVPTVNFFCDNVREFRRVPEEFRGFDLHWVPEAEALPLYRSAGLAHVHAPMPCWVEPKLRNAHHPETGGPTFIGSRDALRAALFGEAIRRGAPLKLHGPGWEEAPGASSEPDGAMGGGTRLNNQADFIRRHGWCAWTRKLAQKINPPPPPPPIPAGNIGPAVSDDDFVRLTQGSEVTVGVNRFPSFRYSRHRPGAYSRLRDLEAPMLGACYLTEWTDGLPLLYELGEEIETYRDAAELAEKIAALGADPARRLRLRTRGQARALADHTIARSLAKISAMLSLTEP